MIWIVYLNVFLSSYRRQHQPSILITSGAGRGMKSHCFVTNLGLEPVYLLDIILDVRIADGRSFRAIIPERNERHRDDEDGDARIATNVGPLVSGEEKDIGRFSILIDRACEENPDLDCHMDFVGVKVTVVTVTASRASLYGAERDYVLETCNRGIVRLRPTTFKARQIDGFFGRRSLAKMLNAELSSSV
ncbi:hypothetical protein [Falsirhodobacter halotolerans]|uniref:hypothetical protein n=1 Tax=Falsirhodobacter halotolerans TaxID=1146892 RepID=UPI001FD2E418|nr:hypothetical protein [Falsirhodobacter halotolerans]MCJ8139956.1 hypothetical protein [Falsirhodobacter halotolerans]